MPRTQKRKPVSTVVVMPKGFYLKRGFWYKRLFKPHPKTGKWGMWAESTKCREEQRGAAVQYAENREAELKKAFASRQSVDPGKVSINDLFDDLLAAQENEDTRKNYESVLQAFLRNYFGEMLPSELNVSHCRAYRKFRRQQGIAHTTINRDLSKVSKAFKLGIQAGKIHSLPPGGFDFNKKPETENTRLVRLPDRYYSFFRDAVHPALRCFFVVSYNIGRRMSQLLATKWSQVLFDEKCLFYPASKKYPHSVKAPFFGEMESVLRGQKRLRDEVYPECEYVFFWFALRKDKDGEKIERFDALWNNAVAALGTKMKADDLEPIHLHVHDLRRSAHYQMRKAGIDSKTRRAIMGHKTGAMDDRYTIIDDEALEDAVAKMNDYQKRQAMISPTIDLERQLDAVSEEDWNRIVASRQSRVAAKTPS
jgi:integrase